MENRLDLLRRKGYWLAKFQILLFSELHDFKTSHNMTNKELADYLNCTEDYLLQLLNGDFDDNLSKYIEICLAIGKIPDIELKDIK